MQGTIPKQLIDHFKWILVEGNIYHMSGFIIILAQCSYRVNDHPYRLKLLRNTFVQSINNADHQISFDRFEFLNFEDVRSRIGDKTFLIGMYIISDKTYKKE